MPTIISRCWKLSFSPLNKSEIINKISEHLAGLDSTSIENYVSNCNYNLTTIYDNLDKLTEYKNFDCLDFFRTIYRRNFYLAFKQLRDFTDDGDRIKLSFLLVQLQKFIEILLSVNETNNSDSGSLIKLKQTLKKGALNQLATFLMEVDTYIKSNINQNLVFNLIIFKIFFAFKRNP